MKTLLNRLFGRAPRTIRNTRPTPARTRLGMESLETRELPAYLSGGDLVISGTPYADSVSVSDYGGYYYQVYENGWTQYFDKASVGRVVFYGYGGNDYFNCTTALLPAVAYGGAGDDSLYGGGGADFLVGEDGNDYINGRGGNDTLIGCWYGWGGEAGGANDTIEGGAGDDSLYGGDGDDFMVGQDGNDYLKGDNGNDTLVGNDGSDSLYGGPDNDTLYGDADTNRPTYVVADGLNFLNGEDGDDNLYGGNGSDYLYGGAGRDGLYGGEGSNYLAGQGGADRFLTEPTNPYASSYVSDALPEDAVIAFRNSPALTGIMQNGQSGTFSFDAGSWRYSDILQVDVALGNLHHHTGNTRLLKTAGGTAMSFLAVGKQTDSNMFRSGGWNNGTEVVFVDPASSSAITLQRTVYHEFGHNWDEASENRYVGNFRAVSGWYEFDSAGPEYTASSGVGDRWYYRTDRADTFARDYGKTNPLEDMATTWEAYFVNAYHGGATGLTQQGLARNDAKWGTLDSLFNDLRQLS
jgi:Ca2+-binding RTX toxin-like protein